jgi:catechol 2,3-dioxygenase-like lactoylglutathione lyase family enzyme
MRWLVVEDRGMNHLIREMKSVVLTSNTIDHTAEFYRTVLGVPLEEEHHGGTSRHWACALGSMHFAIHERATFWLRTDAVVSFTVEDFNALQARLAAHGVDIVARTKIGPMDFIALRDPDGRYVCCGTPWPDAGE